MKRILLYCTIVIAVALSSCTEVIDIDLNNAEKKYVIEGTITDKAGGCRVLITQTKNFDENNNFPGVGGAAVTITDNAGNATALMETSAGVYEAPLLVAVAGATYTMHVTIDTASFTASSMMPVRVPFDSLYITDETLFGGNWKLANVEYNDPPGKGNGYLFVQRVNGVKTKQIYTTNDDITDGNHQSIKLYLQPNTEDEDKLKTGDSVQVEMICLDAAMYKYWYSAGQSSTGSSQSASPANPVSNIQGNALGYFSAQAVEKKAVRVH